MPIWVETRFDDYEMMLPVNNIRSHNKQQWNVLDVEITLQSDQSTYLAPLFV